MTTIKSNSCETASAAGTVVDGTNSAAGGDAFTYFNGSPVYTATAMHGSKAIDCTASGVAAATGWDAFTGTLTFAYRWYLRRTATPSTAAQIMTCRNSTQVIHSVNIRTDNKLQITQGDGSVSIATCATTLTQDTWYRVEATMTVATTSTGSMTWNLYLGDSTTPTETLGPYTNLNFGSTTIQYWRIGKQATSGSIGLIFDDPNINNAATLIGPYSGALDTVRPSSVTSAGTWTVGGSSSNLATATSDDDDTTYARSVDDPSAAAMTVAFPTLNSSSSITVTVRHRAPAGDGNISRQYELLQTATQKATRTVNPLPTDWADYSFTLTSGEAATVTDRTALRLRVTDTKV